MNPIERIQQGYDNLTKAEQTAARHFLTDPRAILRQNLTLIAQECNISNAAVIRMCKKLGYDGFAEFKFSMNRYLLSQGAKSESQDLSSAALPAKDDMGSVAETAGSSAPSPKKPGVSPPLQTLLNTYIQYIEMLPDFVSTAVMNKMASDIVHAQRLSIWGMNRTAQSAMQLSNRLSRLGIYNKVSDDHIVMNDDSNILKEGDVCILFTLNGRGCIEYPQMLASLRERGCTTWLVTMNPDISAAKEAENVVVLPWVSHSSNTNFYEDQIIVYIFIELLLYEVVRLCPN